MKRKLSAISLLCILFLLTSCASDKADDALLEVTNEIVDFRFSLPKSWEYIRNDAMIAVKSNDNNANISVTSFEQKTPTSVNDYFEGYRESFLTAFKNMEIVFDNEIKVDNIPARRITYTNELGEDKFKSDMVIISNKGVIYTVTFTTVPEEYDAAVVYFEDALTSFKFK